MKPVYRVLVDRRAVLVTANISAALAMLEEAVRGRAAQRAPKYAQHIVVERQDSYRGDWTRVAAVER